MRGNNSHCKRWVLFGLFFIACFRTWSVTPANKAVLHVAQVLFEFDASPNASKYHLQIFNNGKLWHSQESAYPAIICSRLFDFGKHFEWNVKSIGTKGETLHTSPIYTFSLATCERSNPRVQKVEITVNKPDKYIQGLVLMDNNLVINRRGKVVFAVDSSIALLRDLTLTPQRTFTYLDSMRFEEIDYTKKVVWRSPVIDNDSVTINFYHHDMQKTAKGTYLCMAAVKYKDINQQVRYNCLVEFDKKNRVVWFWSEKNHYPNDSNIYKASHMNSLDYDEVNEKIYVSNRDLNSIIRIDKPTGRIDFSYGWNVNDSVDYFQNPITKMQHRVVLLPNRNLLVFNNDSAENAASGRTKIQELSNPEIGEAEVVWEYPFQFENEIDNFIPRMGGAIRLPNDNILVACGVSDRNFEVTRKGEIVWEARVTNFKRGEPLALPVYRNNFASSLYPFHFCLYQKGTENESQFLLANTGTESDTYEISFQSEPGEKRKMFKKLMPGKYLLLNVDSSHLIVRSLGSGFEKKIQTSNINVIPKRKH